MKPISPKEVRNKKIDHIDPLMIKAVNNMIVKNYSNHESKFFQCDLIDEYKLVGGKLRRDKLFKDNHLDFEMIYENIGWSVEYDTPAYNESYEPSFTFTSKSKN